MSIVRYRRLGTAALVLLSWAGGESIAASLDALAADGFYTWRVAATDDAPCWCCVSWTGGTPATRACDLDSRNANYGVVDEFRTASGEMQVYALIESGKVQRIRALSPKCAVTSRRDVIDLGAVEVDESLAWLEDNVMSKSAGTDALAAIAVHKGAAALRFLIDTADAGPTSDLRKDAIFWMSQARTSESAGELERMMLRDESAEIRQHAAFSLSQSTAENRTHALIRQGREDTDPEVRSQAWFWLAQTGASRTEEAIQWAIANDPADDVREEAVFAISQLPGERAVDALFAVLGNRQLQQDVREQALFWLVQSDSDRAFDYLDRLLAGGQY